MEIQVKVPKHLRVGAVEVTTSIKPYLKSDDNWRACFNERTGQISVDSQLAGNIRDRSWLHEIVHVIAINYGVSLDEPQIDRMGHGLYEFLLALGISLDWLEIETV